MVCGLLYQLLPVGYQGLSIRAIIESLAGYLAQFKLVLFTRMQGLSSPSGNEADLPPYFCPPFPLIPLKRGSGGITPGKFWRFWIAVGEFSPI